MTSLCSVAMQVAPLRLCSYLLFYVCLLSLFTHITSALIIYNKRTLLDIGHCYTNLLQDSLSTNKRAEIRNRLRKRAHSPPLPSILLTNVQSLENKMDDLRARISFQRDIRDCNIFCLTETWLTTSVPDTAVNARLITFLFYGWTEQPRPVKPKVEECVSWLKRNGVTPGISPFCRVPASLIWNIYTLSATHSICPARFHRSLPLLFTFQHRQTLAWLWPAATLTNTLTLPLSLQGTLTNPTSGRSCRTFSCPQ